MHATIARVFAFPRVNRRTLTIFAFAGSSICLPTLPLAGQVVKAPLPTIPRPSPSDVRQRYDSTELSPVLSPIALYPDPLLAQLLTAATFSKQVEDAAKWSDSHKDLSGQALTDAIAAEQVAWDPSVQAMLAFPTVLQM